MNCNYNRMDWTTTFSLKQFSKLIHSCCNIKSVFTLALLLTFAISGFSMDKSSTGLLIDDLSETATNLTLDGSSNTNNSSLIRCNL